MQNFFWGDLAAEQFIRDSFVVLLFINMQKNQEYLLQIYRAGANVPMCRPFFSRIRVKIPLRVCGE